MLRSFLFVPADKKRMLDKITSLDADAFIIDLEDSVSSQNKEDARINASKILPMLKKEGKIIFVRVNNPTSIEAERDLAKTLLEELDGYIIPKFEDIDILDKFIQCLENLENREAVKKKIPLIIMVESPSGVIGLRKLAIKDRKSITSRLAGIALGGEDYRVSLTISREISKEVLNVVREEIIIFAHSYDILAIDTVYPDFKDDRGFRNELDNIVSMGFTSKFAIHPSQVNIINEVFYPVKEDIDKMSLLLSHEKEINKLGAIDIAGTMYDTPHLKWAKRLERYINNIKKDEG